MENSEYAAVARGPLEAQSQGAEEAEVRAARRVRCLASASVLAVCTAALALWAAVQPSGTSGRAREQSSPAALRGQLSIFEESAEPSRCGRVEEDVEYTVDGGWYMSLDHIPDAEMCCAMCQGVPKCKSFTWVEDAGLDGCPSQCWLKGGEPSAKAAKKGFTSGLPPPRASLQPYSQRPHSKVQREEKGPSSSESKSTGLAFCFELVVPKSYEEGLVKFQYQQNTSIFGCDAWAVYSNVTLKITEGLSTTAVDTDLTVKFGGDSYTALNSWIFIAVWKAVIDEGWHERFDWIVKADPDAVFMSHRLRPILLANAGVGYINNCKYGLHGPIEVVSNTAMATLAADYEKSFDGKAPRDCVEKLHFGEWGEDFFLSRCLHKIHHVTRNTESELICEAHCDCDDWYWCDGADRVTYHPFKRTDMYEQCMANTLAAEGKADARKNLLQAK